MCADWIILDQHGQYHGCWCSGFFHWQDISTRDIDYVLALYKKNFNYMWHVSVEEWYKPYTFFMFPMNDLARKGLFI